MISKSISCFLYYLGRSSRACTIPSFHHTHKCPRSCHPLCRCAPTLLPDVWSVPQSVPDKSIPVIDQFPPLFLHMQHGKIRKIRSVGSSASSSLSVSRSSCSCASVRASASRNSPTLVRTRLCMVPPQHSFPQYRHRDCGYRSPWNIPRGILPRETLFPESQSPADPHVLPAVPLLCPLWPTHRAFPIDLQCRIHGGIWS